LINIKLLVVPNRLLMLFSLTVLLFMFLRMWGQQGWFIPRDG